MRGRVAGAGWITGAGWVAGAGRAAKAGCSAGAGWAMGVSCSTGAGCSVRDACECETWARARASLDGTAWAMVEPRSGGTTPPMTTFSLVDRRGPVS
ncbi:hypothetical protein ACFX2C_019012 [Malus domestica]